MHLAHILCYLIAGLANAALKKATEALQNGRLLSAAVIHRLDNAFAQVNVGVCGACGRSTLATAADAVVLWHQQAAVAGSADALFNLGRCYEDGEGVEADAAQAIVWCTAPLKPATLCHSTLSACSTSQDTSSASTLSVQWRGTVLQPMRATRNAQFKLGVCCENGRGDASRCCRSCTLVSAGC